MGGTWEVKSEYRALFLEESQDQIQEWEESLLNLEKTPSDREFLDTLFRSIHTLKGSAGFVGFGELQEMTHDLESTLQDVRDGNTELVPEMLEALFNGLDLCRQMIEAFAEDHPFEGSTASLLDALQKLQSSPEETNIKEEKDSEEETNAPDTGTDSRDKLDKRGEEKIYSIYIEIDAMKKEAYLRALLVQSKLEEIGKIITIKPSLEGLRLIDDDFKFQIVLETEREVEDLKKALNIDLVKVLGVHESKKETDETDKETLKMANRKSEPQKEMLSRLAKTEDVVRVPVEKLDVMLNLVGELVIQKSGFISTTEDLQNQYGRSSAIIDLEGKTESLAKIARDLQDAVMKVRMLPVAAVFNRFNRVVRDLSKDRGKEINLEIFGEETEIDKKVTDRIGEPLVHLVRNAVDHGIESKEERVASGKSATGHIRLGAYQEGDHICIEVSDDGKGLDRERIVNKALEKGLLKKEDIGDLSKEEIYGLIFLPGFSTAKEVTDISGRGVGLDVVKRTVDDMGGSLLVKSLKNRGTTITITLPLTMAIISAILVETSSSLFAIPLSSVKEIIQEKKSALGSVGQQSVVRLREEVLPVVHLNEVLALPEDGTSSGPVEDPSMPIVIVGYGENKIGLAVKRLLDNEEIVIKSLSKHYREIEGFIGASIMGDGRIALILDTEAIVKRYTTKSGGEDTLSGGLNLRAAIQSNAEKKDVPVFDDEKAEEEGEVEQDDENSESKLARLDKPNPANEKNNEQNEKTEEPLIQLDEKQKEIFEEIHNSGAINASISLSMLLNQDVRVSFPETGIVPLGDVAAQLGGEENPVGGIYIGINGDVTGGILIVLPTNNILQLCDILYQHEPGTTQEVGETEVSGVSEMGNILSASFINAMADTTGLSVLSSVPEMSIDMCLSVIDSILATFNQPGDHILMTKAEIFFSDNEQAVCHMLLFLEQESLKKVMGELSGEKISGEKIEQAGG